MTQGMFRARASSMAAESQPELGLPAVYWSGVPLLANVSPAAIMNTRASGAVGG